MLLMGASKVKPGLLPWGFSGQRGILAISLFYTQNEGMSPGLCLPGEF